MFKCPKQKHKSTHGQAQLDRATHYGDDRMESSLRYRRCDNCFFSVWMMNPNRPVLTCMQKVNFVGRWRGVLIEDSCCNFYPSSIFRAGKNGVRRIALTQGKFAIVDRQDYYRLVRFRWFAAVSSNTFYAVRKHAGKPVKMHREIMGAPAHLVVDHIDRDGLNNARSNLRLCSQAQNSRNAVSNNGARSKNKGDCR